MSEPTRLVDLFEITQLTHPEWFAQDEEPVSVDADLPPLIPLG